MIFVLWFLEGCLVPLRIEYFRVPTRFLLNEFSCRITVSGAIMQLAAWMFLHLSPLKFKSDYAVSAVRLFDFTLDSVIYIKQFRMSKSVHKLSEKWQSAHRGTACDILLLDESVMCRNSPFVLS